MSSNEEYSPPRPRKHMGLWQAYKWWYQLNEINRKYQQRMKAIEDGKSVMSAYLEQEMYEVLEVETKLEVAAKAMAREGKKLGAIWEWVTGIKGIAGNLGAKLLARIDDIGRFDTISKLWRYAGYAVIDGEIDHPQGGEKRPYDAQLKSAVYEITDQFVRQRTPIYRAEYDEYREEDRRKHPNAICKKCGTVFSPTIRTCPECGQTNKGLNLLYCNAHMHMRAKRKAGKLFLSHLWVNWRKMDGLTVTDPYVQDVLGHTHIIPPPDLPDEDDSPDEPEEDDPENE
jgi:hypothetical protein